MKIGFFSIFVITLLITFSGLQLVNVFVDLKPGESIGKDWYLIKSYEEKEIIKNNKVYIEKSIVHGEGPIYLAVLAAFIISGIYLIITFIKKRKKTNLSQ